MPPGARLTTSTPGRPVTPDSRLIHGCGKGELVVELGPELPGNCGD